MDEIRISGDVRLDPKIIKKIVKQAPSADSLSLVVYDGELFLVLFRNDRPIAKINALWARDAVVDFESDLQDQMRLV